ncbi:RHS repeat-associated core domain-containing protein [Nonomuraea sp. NPDC050663]|uniref:RHS repeat-associated core domain-containing protein n=1 Tax=Nonomuraea sp. NPDC050663 TaxID=3364370 RepID=UPI0037A488CC
MSTTTMPAWRQLVVALLSTVLVITLVEPVQATRSTPEPKGPAEPQKVEPVKGKAFVAPPAKPDPEAAKDPGEPKVTWPEAGAAEVALADAATASAGQLPIRVAAGKDRAAAPGRVAIEVHDRAAAQSAGVDGLLLSVRRADSKAESGPVTITVDYSAFKDAYGGDWAARLQLTPVLPGQTPVTAVRNDLKAATITAEVSVDDKGGMIALAAPPAGSTGDYKATSLSPSGTWQVSAQGGEFAWTYPMRTPPVPGELQPELSVAYSSGSVDGRVVAANSQPSWVGEGWNLWPGFIERSYKACLDDLGGNNGQTKTGDLCWEDNIVTVAFGAYSGRLLFKDGVWRPERDDGTTVERLTGAVNGDEGDAVDGVGEHWRITTTDGTKYHFGLNRLPNWTTNKPVTQSAWTVPVFGNDDNGTAPDEPCYKPTFAASVCAQAYRWNLDYVVDAHGNSMSYFYNPEVGKYGRNMATATASYIRGGTLARIEYGTRTGHEYNGWAPARVVFQEAHRCVAGQDCTQHTKTAWPDVPWSLDCTTATCPNKISPTFWTTKRLSRVTTQVSNGNGAYRNVDVWDFAHTYPNPGDGTDPGLWLNAITHTGQALGTAIPKPQVTFDAEMLPNRVNSLTDGLPKLWKPRIKTITTETGGAINVNYLAPDCADGAAAPTPATNTKRCFPVRWLMPPATTLRNDWFHKYVVATVIEDDLVTDAKDMVTTYRYTGGAAWAFDDHPMVPVDKRSWSEWRGYEKVAVLKGDTVNDPGKPLSRTDYLFFRGMHGDRNASGGTKTVNVTSSDNVAITDWHALSGFLREEITYNGDTAEEVTGKINDPWVRVTATQGSRTANQVETVRTVTRTKLAAGGHRTTRVDTEYDHYGNATKINDHGDTGTTGDERCTTSTYVPNTTAMLLTLPSRTQTTGVACGTTPTYPNDAITDTRYSYDGRAFGEPPDHGDVTQTEVADAYNGGTPHYITTKSSSYDDFGRVLDTSEAPHLDKKTTKAFTDTNGLTTAVKETNPLGHVKTTTFDPAWGHPLTETDANGRETAQVYDALGRVVRVYKPGRSAASGDSPHLRFVYGLRRSGGPNWVRTETLKANGNHVATYELYDGFLRSRQTQAPSPFTAGGRILTDKKYDSRGLNSVAMEPQYNDTASPGTSLFQITDANTIRNATINVYDGAERQTEAIYLFKNKEQWRTSTKYGGDRVTVYPPLGGTSTTTITDARDRKIELRQYRTRAAGGSDDPATHDKTKYTHTPRGDLATITDAVGNIWRHTYNVLGHKVKSEDPDVGMTTMTYDAGGRLLTTTDARGKTVTSVYDVIGRKTETRLGSETGELLSKTLYDTLAIGSPTSWTRRIAGRDYTKAIVGYDEAGRPTGESVTIPTVDGAPENPLATTYTTTMAYKDDGSLASRTLPELAPGVARETLTYGYNDFGLPTTVSGAMKYIAATEYNALGETSQREFGPTGKQVTQTPYYDEGTRRINQVLTERDHATLTLAHNVIYTYDPAGNIIETTGRTDGTALASQCFTYDYLRRVTAAWTQNGDSCAATPTASVVGGSAPYWHQYAYDVIGNRRSMIVKGLAGAADITSAYTYESTRPHAVTSVTTGGTTATYAYSASGQTTSQPGPAGTQTLTWDDEGQLASITSGDQSTSYVHDAEGKQLIRRDPGAVTLFIGDDEIHLDTATGAKTATRYYSGIGTRTSAGFFWTVGDQVGTSEVAIDATTLAVTTRRFDLFGNPRGTSPAWPAGDRAFVGGTANAATGLTRLGAREYDPELGRFISADPIIDPMDPQQINGYAYANNSPVSMSDPDGQFASWIYSIAALIKRMVSRARFTGQAGKWGAPRRVAYRAGYTVRRVVKPRPPLPCWDCVHSKYFDDGDVKRTLVIEDGKVIRESWYSRQKAMGVGHWRLDRQYEGNRVYQRDGVKTIVHWPRVFGCLSTVGTTIGGAAAVTLTTGGAAIAWGAFTLVAGLPGAASACGVVTPPAGW